MLADWTGKTITVLGLSRSGAAVARYVARRGGDVFLSETAPASPQNEELRRELEALGVAVEMGGHGRRCFSHADLVVASPGIPPSGGVLEQLLLSGKTILSEVEFAWREISSEAVSSNPPVIGVTGTNGKSTTTTLISWILTEAGRNAPACGNIGIPITDVIADAVPVQGLERLPSPNRAPGLPESTAHRPLDALVVELSSFQLEFSPTLKPAVAILTNFKPDHLDWHGGLDAYREAKLKLFSGARSPEWSILPADDPIGSLAATRTEGEVLWFSRNAASVADKTHKIYLDADRFFVLEARGNTPIRLFRSDELAIIGDHNEENVLAGAAAAWLAGVGLADITRACLSFQGLEHRLERLEPVGPLQVLFYNDSKATNTDAAISALRAFKTRPVILIAGGYDKMTPLDEFVAEVRQHARAVILTGAAKERFARALAEDGYDAVTFAPDLEAAAAQALQLSENGEKDATGTPAPVLFSPACSSFDRFRNFEERGRAFKAAVAELRTRFENPVRS
jgi:UDP-N-acetylmuramoylalanine--D-glutamate ligase